jgi:hypothetical protein
MNKTITINMINSKKSLEETSFCNKKVILKIALEVMSATKLLN